MATYTPQGALACHQATELTLAGSESLCYMPKVRGRAAGATELPCEPIESQDVESNQASFLTGNRNSAWDHLRFCVGLLCFDGLPRWSALCPQGDQSVLRDG